jgi:hypothetical protein
MCCSHLTGLLSPGYIDDCELKQAKTGISNHMIWHDVYNEFHENWLFNVTVMVQNLYSKLKKWTVPCRMNTDFWGCDAMSTCK